MYNLIKEIMTTAFPFDFFYILVRVFFLKTIPVIVVLVMKVL